MIAPSQAGIAGGNSVAVAAIVEQSSTSKNRFTAGAGASSSGSGGLPKIDADATSAVHALEIPTGLAEDIQAAKNRFRSAELHSRVMRNVATDQELAEYRDVRMNRRVEVRSKTILADYEELRRMAEIEQKLAELKQLFRPIPR